MSKKRKLPVVSGKPKARQCGTCDACCTVLDVPWLHKPARKPCEHLGAKGCGIYATRPPECGTFSCLWLLDGVDKELRPDRCGVIIAANLAVLDEQTVSVWEVWENASQQGDGLRIVSFMARTHAVIVTDHAGMVRVMGPPDRVDAAVARLKAAQGDSNAGERDTGASHT